MFDGQHQHTALTEQTSSGQASVQKAVYLKDNRGLENPVQRKANNTGLGDNLKSGIENLSGHSKMTYSNPVVVQRAATKINYVTGTYEYTDANGEDQEQTVGVEMQAHLNPAEPREGTSPSGMDGLMAALGRKYDHQRMIRGHLLNGNLGGLGIPENLFPITNRANRLHETQVENHVKAELADQNEVDYEVEVIQAGMKEDEPDATFHCQMRVGGQKILDKDIDSFPSKNRKNSAGSLDNQPGAMNNLGGGRSFANADLEAMNWGERGSGRRGELEYEEDAFDQNKYVMKDNTNDSENSTINA